MPTNSNAIRSSQHDFYAFSGDTWEQIIEVYTRQGSTLQEVEQAPWVPMDLREIAIVMRVMDEETEEVVFTMSTELGSINIQGDDFNHFRFYTQNLPVAGGRYKYTVKFYWTNGDNYTYMVGPVYVAAP